MTVDITSLEMRIAVLERRVTANETRNIAITDQAGVLRVEGGKLPARGASGAQVGLRVNNAGGVPIFDSLGLIGVMTLLGAVGVSATTVATANMSTFAAVTGSTTNFTLARSASVFIAADLTGKVTGAPGNYAIAEIQVQGSYVGGATPLYDKNVLGYTNGFMTVNVGTLAAGTYAATIAVATEAGETLNVYGGDVYVYLLGA